MADDAEDPVVGPRAGNLGIVIGNSIFFTLTAEEFERFGLGSADSLSISPPGSRHLWNRRPHREQLAQARPLDSLAPCDVRTWQATRETDATVAAIGTATVGCPRLDGAEPLPRNRMKRRSRYPLGNDPTYSAWSRHQARPRQPKPTR